MLTDEREKIVDDLSDEQLAFDVERGRSSRFQGDLLDYARTQLKLRTAAKQAAVADRGQQTAELSLNVAKQTKNITVWGIVIAVVLVFLAWALTHYLGA